MADVVSQFTVVKVDIIEYFMYNSVGALYDNSSWHLLQGNGLQWPENIDVFF